MEEEFLQIQRGGALILARDGNTHEVNRPTPAQLHDYKCVLQEGVTLRDIFIFLSKDIDFWDSLLGNWCKEYVVEGLKSPLRIASPDEDIFTIDYLELFKSMEISKQKGKLRIDSSRLLEFQGVGTYTEDDPNSSKKKGDKTNIGISLTPANELAHLEVRINSKMDICFEEENAPPKAIYEGVEFSTSLFEILYGILWELSFHGAPQSREDDRKELLSMVDEIKTSSPPFSSDKK